MKTQPWTVLAAVLVASVFAVAGCASGAAKTTRDSGFAGVVQRPVLTRPSFHLTDMHGRPYDFREHTKGRLTLLYFGYTHCLTECPTTLATVASALRRLPADQRHHVRLVLVTTDPQRDTGPVLREYLHRFDPSFIGLSGTPRQVAQAERLSSAQPSEKEPAKPGHDYQVAHTTWLYAYGLDDAARIVYGPRVSVGDLRHDLPLLLAGKKPSPGTELGLGASAGLTAAAR
jgi:protein SCO1/2